MKSLKDLLLISILSVALIECSDLQKKELEVEKKKLEIEVNEDISTRINKMIKDAKWPTEETKSKLLALKANTQNKVENINIQLKKAKILLVQNLIANDSTTEKLRLLKKEIRKLYKKKVDLMFEALEVAMTIVGKGKRDTQFDSMFHHYLMNEY